MCKAVLKARQQYAISTGPKPSEDTNLNALVDALKSIFRIMYDQPNSPNAWSKATINSLTTATEQVEVAIFLTKNPNDNDEKLVSTNQIKFSKALRNYSLLRAHLEDAKGFKYRNSEFMKAVNMALKERMEDVRIAAIGEAVRDEMGRVVRFAVFGESLRDDQGRVVRLAGMVRDEWAKMEENGEVKTGMREILRGYKLRGWDERVRQIKGIESRSYAEINDVGASTGKPEPTSYADGKGHDRPRGLLNDLDNCHPSLELEPPVSKIRKTDSLAPFTTTRTNFRNVDLPKPHHHDTGSIMLPDGKATELAN